MGEAVGIVIDGKTIATLRSLRDRLRDDPQAGMGRLPEWMPDGSPVRSVKQVGALLGMDARTAALAVLQSNAAPASLTREAKDVYAQSGAHEVTHGLHDGLRKRPKRQRIINRACTLCSDKRRKKRKRGDTP